MSHTDRDARRYLFKHHKETCTRYIPATEWRRYPQIEQWCECIDWYDYQHAKFWPTPSAFYEDCRREERAKERNMMQRARAGHVEWDDLPLGGSASRHYRRPFYW